MSHKVVTTDLEYLMAAARPRLVRFACAQGITADAADDVVQETLLEAWRHFDRLYSLESFEAWLYGICRNVCRRWMRERRVQLQHALPMEVVQDTVLFNIPDPLNLDPAEELSLQDLQVLLDHALGYLSDENRLLIELCYLAEMPQRETALRLGTTIHALESRLYRACRQLHQVLTRELRTEAEIFGLTNACVHTYTHSAVQRFRQRYPRAFAEPHIYTEYAGLPAIRQNFTDAANSAQVSVFVHRESLLLLAVFQA